MSNALFLPRELFEPASPVAAGPVQPAARPRRGVHFASGEAVAADLLKGPASANALHFEPAERRRKPRVDIYLA